MSTPGKNLSSYDPSLIPPAGNLKIAIVVSEWNDQVTGQLARGAQETLIKHGVNPSNLLIMQVPGSFELPLAARMLIESNPLDAVILPEGVEEIGAEIILGNTFHLWLRPGM